MTEREILFVGEQRSNRAVELGYRWNDGRLAAKQLFDALRANGLRPELCSFTNLFERGGLAAIRRHKGVVIGMGGKVQRELERRRIVHVCMVHPAARGAIRRKDRYAAHVRGALNL